MTHSHKLNNLCHARMEIFVENGSPALHKTFTIETKPLESVGELKARIEDREGIPATQQRLMFDFKQLDDDQIISDCNIKHKSRVYLTLRMNDLLQLATEDQITRLLELCEIAIDEAEADNCESPKPTVHPDWAQVLPFLTTRETVRAAELVAAICFACDFYFQDRSDVKRRFKQYLTAQRGVAPQSLMDLIISSPADRYISEENVKLIRLCFDGATPPWLIEEVGTLFRRFYPVRDWNADRISRLSRREFNASVHTRKSLEQAMATMPKEGALGMLYRVWESGIVPEKGKKRKRSHFCTYVASEDDPSVILLQDPLITSVMFAVWISRKLGYAPTYLKIAQILEIEIWAVHVCVPREIMGTPWVDSDHFGRNTLGKIFDNCADAWLVDAMEMRYRELFNVGTTKRIC